MAAWLAAGVLWEGPDRSGEVTAEPCAVSPGGADAEAPASIPLDPLACGTSSSESSADPSPLAARSTLSLASKYLLICSFSLNADGILPLALLFAVGTGTVLDGPAAGRALVVLTGDPGTRGDETPLAPANPPPGPLALPIRGEIGAIPGNIPPCASGGVAR